MVGNATYHCDIHLADFGRRRASRLGKGRYRDFAVTRGTSGAENGFVSIGVLNRS